MSAVVRLVGLVAVLLAVTLVSTCARAHGLIPPITQQLWTCQFFTGQVKTGATAMDACSASAADGSTTTVNSSTTTVRTVTVSSCTAGHCVGTVTVTCNYNNGQGSCGGGTSPVEANASTNGPQQVCPGNSEPVAGGQCKCLPGTRRGASGVGPSCDPYTCTKNGLRFENDGYGPLTQDSAMNPRVTCVGPGNEHHGCALQFTPQSAKCADPTHCWNLGSSATNGNYCDGTPAAPATAPPDEPTLPPPTPPCPANQCPGTVNGASVCVACGVTDAPKTTTETNPDGTTKGTTTKTECDGEKCTTTTTTKTTDGDGNESTSTKTETEDQSSYCEQNPTATACKESKWRGQCGGGFQCDGDAIQCAIANEQHQRNCAMFDTPDALATKGAGMVDDNPTPQGHPANSPEVKDVGLAGQIDMSNPIGGSCPQDKTLSMGGQTFTLPLSTLCTPLQMLGQVGVAVSLLMAAFIAFKQG